MSFTRIAMWAMPFMGGRVVGAAAAAAVGGAGAVCAAATPERPAASANRAKQRSAVHGDGILLENLLGDMGSSSRRWLGAILSSSRILAEWSGNAKPGSRRLSSRTHHQCSFSVVSQFEVRDKRSCRKRRFQGRSRPYPDAPFGSIDGLEWLLQTAFAEHSFSRLDFIFNFR
jgi:hypothetical protein